MIRFGMKLPEIFNQLVKGYQKVRGQKPTGLDLIKIKQEAMLRFQEMRKVLDMQRNPIDPNKPIIGGKQLDKNAPGYFNDFTSMMIKDANVAPKVVKSGIMKTKEAMNPKFIDFTIDSFKNMDGIKVMKEANKIIKREGPYKDLTKNDAKRIMDAVDDKLKNIDMDPEDMYADGGRIGLFLGGNLEGGYSKSRTDSGGKQTTVSFGGGEGGNKKPPPPKRTSDGGVTDIKLKKPTRFNNIDNDFTKFNIKDLIGYGLVNPEEEENTQLAKTYSTGDIEKLLGIKDQKTAEQFIEDPYTSSPKFITRKKRTEPRTQAEAMDLFRENLLEQETKFPSKPFEAQREGSFLGISPTDRNLVPSDFLDKPGEAATQMPFSTIAKEIETKYPMADGEEFQEEMMRLMNKFASNDMNERLLEKLFEDLLEQGLSPEEAEIKAREMLNEMGDMSSIPDRGAQSITLADGGRAAFKDGTGMFEKLFFNKERPILSGLNTTALFDLVVAAKDAAGPFIGLADGGRAAFKDGPKDPRRRTFMKAAAGIASMIPFGGAKIIGKAAPVVAKAAEMSGPALAKIVETVMSVGKLISVKGKRVKEMVTKKKHEGVEVTEDIMDGSYTIKKGGKEIYYKPGKRDEMGIEDDIIEVIEKTVTKKASGGVARMLGE